MSYKLLNSFLPLLLEQVFVTHHLQLVHEAVDVLDQDIVSRDQHFLLSASTQSFVSWVLVGTTGRGVLGWC